MQASSEPTARRTIRGRQGVTLSGVYSACTTQTQLLSPAVYDTQSCNNYYLRSIDNQCQKTLTVQVTWNYVCPAGTISGPTPVAGSTAQPPDQSCQVQHTETQYQCAPPNTGPTVDALGNQVCTTPSNTTIPATAVTVTTVSTELATPVATVTDHWANGCASLEALVPPGYLLPDGDNTTVGTGGTTTLDRQVLSHQQRMQRCHAADAAHQLPGGDSGVLAVDQHV